MLVGGLPIGRVTLVCGGPGAGKTMLATQFLVSGAPELDEPGLFVSFEELPAELVANSASLGWDRAELIGDGRLRVEEIRAAGSELTEAGPYELEALFARLGYAIDAVGARRVVLDTLETLFGALCRRGNLGVRASRGPSVRSRRGARGQVDVVRKSTRSRGITGPGLAITAGDGRWCWPVCAPAQYARGLSPVWTSLSPTSRPSAGYNAVGYASGSDAR